VSGAIGFRFRCGTSAIPREKRESMSVLANQRGSRRITENTSFSELFGESKWADDTLEVTGSSPVSPIEVNPAERDSCVPARIGHCAKEKRKSSVLQQ
jgi:hypothetical protein